MTLAVALFSGGMGSWAAASRYRSSHSEADLTLLFTDTGSEDHDLYRFMVEAANTIENAHMIRLGGKEGDLWDLFDQQGMIANTRADFCSRIRKREPARKWIDRHAPEGCDVIVGIDWTEAHRYERMVPHWLPHKVVAPLLEEPLLGQDDHEASLTELGIEIPRLYKLGFQHNNCGGFCVKQGHGGFQQLLEKIPERYAYHEQREREFRERTGKDVAVLRDRRGGVTKPMTLETFRLRIEAGGEQLDLMDWDDTPGCDSCMMT